MNNSFQDLEQAFNSINLSMYTDEFAGQLLAFFNIYAYEIGEQAILNVSFREALKACSKKFNIQGGETPTTYGETLLNKYIREGKKNPKSNWVKEIIARYKLKGFKKILT